MRFLGGYPPGVLDQVRALIAAGGCEITSARHYPAPHT